MNKRQKIIVSITGITLVLLILVGLTYAYFLTRIQGNTNTKSISVTTADLALVYGDGNGYIHAELIQPGTTLGTKTFTVTNEGNVSVEYGVFLEDVINDFSRTQDLQLTITCESSVANKTCSGYTGSMLTRNDMLLTNSIDEDEVQSYTLTLEYIEAGIDQSADMNKKLEAKVDIKDIKALNPYSDNQNSLAYNIINNSMLKKNGTELRAVPLTKPAEEITTSWGTGNYTYETVSTSSLCAGYNSWLVSDSEAGATYNSGVFNAKGVSSFNDAVGKWVFDQCKGWTKYLQSYDSSNSTLTFRAEIQEYEKELSVTPDDLGTSYYYRGAVEDNYLNFAGMCWRIVRIEGDGSIKLVLEDQDNTCASSDGNWDIPTTGGSATGNFGYTEYAAGTLTASNGTKNSSTVYVMDYLNGETNSTDSMATTFKNFQTGTLTTNIANNYSNATLIDYLKIDNWCMNDKGYSQSGSSPNYIYTELTETEMLDRKVSGTAFYYDSYVRLRGDSGSYNPTLKCNGTVMNKFGDNTTNMYVGTLTADEIVYAGGKVNRSNKNYYLNSSKMFWFLSPSSFNNLNDGAFGVNSVTYSGGVYDYSIITNNALRFRPAVSLKNGTTISDGVGTKTSPYVIN